MRFKKLKPNELNRAKPDEYSRQSKMDLIVILDNFRSMHNVGSVFRSADAFAVSEVWLTGFTAKPPHREIHKTALGATETVKWRYFNDAAEAIGEIKKKKLFLWVVEQSANSLGPGEIETPISEGNAVVFGNEIDGVSEKFMKAARGAIEIPQVGTKHSLNVSVAAGIIIWEFWKKLYRIQAGK